MPALTPSLVDGARLSRVLATAALSAATLLAATLAAAHADPAAQPAPSAADSAATRSETLEERITNLHAALQITPSEESDWNAVAQTMRDNEAALEKLSADKLQNPPQNRGAVGDLEAYERYAQAHVDGLKKLIASFETLYDAMPAPQKKVADDVFESFGHKSTNPARG
jgi:TolA-binding protein